MLRSMYKGNVPLKQASTVSKEAVDDIEGEGDEEAEENDSLGSLPSAASRSGGASMAPPPLVARKRHSKSTHFASTDSSEFEPISSGDCFEEAFEVELEDQGKWRVYLTPPRPPSSPLQHPATTASRTVAARTATQSKQRVADTLDSDLDLASLQPPNVDDDDDDDDEEAIAAGGSGGAALHATAAGKKKSPPNPGTMIFFHHGAGFSGLSFALAAKEITKLTNGEVGVMAIDCRGHGRTTHSASVPLPLDMSPTRLTQDCVEVLTKLYPDVASIPSLLLVGHSMGGSVVVSLSSALQALSVRVSGVAVLDVVEGTAMEAMPGMRHIVEQLPKGFNSVQDAIKWHVDSGQIHNVESARRSVPSLVVPNPDHDPETHEAVTAGVITADTDEAIEELKEDPTIPANVHGSDATAVGGTIAQAPPFRLAEPPKRFVWRHDLLSTSAYWSSWFKGLSSAFLAVKAARLLVLAGTDRLDRDLMVGQMQGKYQLQVLQDVGHCLHEDAPDRTAALLVDFWKRNEVVPAKLAGLGVGLRKVGQ